MFKNYLKIAFRNLLKQKAYSFINIFGLSVGLCSAILITLWIVDELSYDRFHPKEERLYQAWNRSTFDGQLECWNVTPAPLGPALKANFPGIAETCRVDWLNLYLLSHKEKNLHVEGVHVDPGFLTMFGFPLRQGNPEKALEGTNSIVITESLALKLLGTKDALNKVIKLENKDSFTIKGVLKDLPSNTEFDFEFLLPWTYLEKNGRNFFSWGNNSYKTYVELSPKASLENVNRKIRDITIRNTKNEEDTEVFLHSIKNWRLYSQFENGQIAGGRIEYVQLFGIIAALILLIACINFMNLATARSEKRVKEVGIRKTIGAKRESLIGQFLGESILLASLGLILAILLTELALPWFNELTKKQLYIDYGNPLSILVGLIFILFTGLLAGSYPAFYLSSFQPVKVLKGTVQATHSSLSPRKVLVVLQFTFSIALIICTIIIYQQIQFAQNRNNGYDKDRLVFHYFTGDLRKKYSLIKQDLLSQGVATAVCKTNHPITSANSNTWGLSWEGKNPDKKIIFDQLISSEDLVKTMGIEITQGRDIDLKTYKTDSMACIINEAGIKVMRMKDPLGKNVDYDGEEYKIVGVFKDFIWGSPYRDITPMFVRPADWYNVMTLRLSPDMSSSQGLKKAEAIFKKHNPYYPFEYHFVDEEYAKKFSNERLIANLANIFALLTVIISCLGLFGLAAYTAEQRTKEIGVRKVLGAKVWGIVRLLSKDFLRLVFISYLIASPLAWYLMQGWLDAYKYRVSISIWVFLLAGILALVIALLTVSYQAFKASKTDPVKALKYE